MCSSAVHLKNADDPMTLIPSLNLTDANELHSPKALLSSVVKDAGNAIPLKSVQPLNAEPLIVCKPSFKITLDNDVHPENAESPILVIVDGITIVVGFPLFVLSPSLTQPTKAPCPISVIPDEMEIFTRFIQFTNAPAGIDFNMEPVAIFTTRIPVLANAFFPIDDTVLGIVSVAAVPLNRFEHSLNPSFPIVSRPSGKLTNSKLLHW